MPKGRRTTVNAKPGTVFYAKVISNQSQGSIGSTLANSSTTNSSPSILKAKSGHILDTTAGQTMISVPDDFADFNLLTAAATTASNASTFTAIENNEQPPIKRRKQDPKTGKGLRHFSMKVCEKVKLKGTTTYNEVADELVAEFSADPIASRAAFQGGYLPCDQEPFDQKNIRRRVYDALNVLMAMNIISKEKKEIKWIGLPTNAAQECIELEQDKEERLERIDAKKQQLRDLLIQQIAIKNLVERNKNQPVPSSNAIIYLPFIIVNTNKRTVIDCSISNDKSEYLFNFDNTFEIHDDIEVLKRMGFAFGLDKTSFSDIDKNDYEKARSILPEALRSELDEMMKEKLIS